MRTIKILLVLLLIAAPCFGAGPVGGGGGGSGTGDLLSDGTVPLTANWDVGSYSIRGTQFISDIAIGTAPFVVTSTTVVTNLNADLLDGHSSAYFAPALTAANVEAALTNDNIDFGSGVVTATGFAGPLTGNVTGDVSGSSGSCTGNAATATTAAEVGTTAGIGDTAFTDLTNGGSYSNFGAAGDDTVDELFAAIDTAIGGLGGGHDALTLGASLSSIFSLTDQELGLTAWPTFNQNTTGNAATATTAGITPVDTGDENATFYPVLVDGATGLQATETDGEFTYNPDSGVLTVPSITSSGGVTIAGTASGGQYVSILEDTDNGAHYSGWGIYGDIVASYLLAPPLAVSAGGQALVFAAPGNQTMSDGTTKSVSVGTWVTPLVSGGALGTPSGGTLTNCTGLPASGLTTMNAYANIPIAWMVDGTSAPDALDSTTRKPYAYRTFDNSADEDLNMVWFVPSDLSGSVIQFRVKYLVTNATGPSDEDVCFALSGVSLGDNDATNGAKGTPVAVLDEGITAAQHDILVTPWSGDVTVTNLAAGEVAELALIRDVSGESGGAYGQVVGVIGIELRYTKDPA